MFHCRSIVFYTNVAVGLFLPTLNSILSILFYSILFYAILYSSSTDREREREREKEKEREMKSYSSME